MLVVYKWLLCPRHVYYMSARPYVFCHFPGFFSFCVTCEYPHTYTAVLSGKQLFTYNASLFVDDEGAADQADEEEYQREQKLREEREEAMQRAAALKAQEEQDRLLELHRCV